MYVSTWWGLVLNIIETRSNPKIERPKTLLVNHCIIVGITWTINSYWLAKKKKNLSTFLKWFWIDWPKNHKNMMLCISLFLFFFFNFYICLCISLGMKKKYISTYICWGGGGGGGVIKQYARVLDKTVSSWAH